MSASRPPSSPPPPSQSTAPTPPPPPPVDTQAGLEALVEVVRAAPLVGFDTEFHPEGSYVPELMLVQISTPAGAVAVDPLAIDVAPLVEALCAEGTTVIAHAAQADLQILQAIFGTLPSRLFDTQLAAAFAGRRLQESLATLAEDILGIEVCKGQRFTDWSVRPLAAQQLTYALGDVEPLLALREALLAELEQKGTTAWFEEDAARLTQAAAHERDPVVLAARTRGAERLDRRGYAALIELVTERERLAEERDLPRNKIAANGPLLELARRLPKDRRSLFKIKKLPAPVVRRYGERLLGAIERARARPRSGLPTPPPPRRSDDPRLTAMREVVRVESERVGLPPELVGSASMLRLALMVPLDGPGALCRAAGLAGWREKLLGDALWGAYSAASASA